MLWSSTRLPSDTKPLKKSGLSLIKAWARNSVAVIPWDLSSWTS